MIKIEIGWNFISPSLGVLSGVVTISNHFQRDGYLRSKTILKFKIKKEKTCLGYESLDGKGIPSDLLNVFKEKIDIMTNAYYKGMMLDELQYQWIESSSDKTFGGWLKETNYKKPNKSLLKNVVYKIIKNDALNIKRKK